MFSLIYIFFSFAIFILYKISIPPTYAAYGIILPIYFINSLDQYFVVDRARRRRSIRHGGADRGGETRMPLPGRRRVVARREASAAARSAGGDVEGYSGIHRACLTRIKKWPGF